MKLVTRRQWGGPGSIGGTANPTRGCVAHYNGGPIGLAGKVHSACVDYVRRVHRMHLGRGWAGGGYSFLVCPCGYVFEMRGLSRAQAAQPGGNTTWYSIQMMVGGSEKPTAKQVQAWRDARTYIRARRSVAAAIRGHYQFTSTSCPGAPTKGLIADGSLSKAGSSTPGTGGGSGSGSEASPVIGLKKGDRGQRVIALQRLITYAGGTLPRWGVDGDYGDETAAALLQVRKSVGSEAKSGWGDRVTGTAYAQLHRAMARHEASR